MAPELHQRDVYSSYEVGLRQLLDQMQQDHSRYREALSYQQRLVENIAKSRRYGDTDTRKAERSEIIDGLNEFALSVLGISFAQLCSPISSLVGPDPSESMQADNSIIQQNIMHLLYRRHNQDPDDLIECTRLAEQLQIPKTRVASNVRMLEEEEYVTTVVHRRGSRRYEFVQITTKGVLVVEHPERIGEPLRQEVHHHYHGDYINVKVGDHSRGLAIGKEIRQVNVDGLDSAGIDGINGGSVDESIETGDPG